MSTYEISKSSLLSLKAEILRKQQELVKAKVDNEVKIKLIKKNTPLEIKNKGIEARQNKDLEEVDADLLKQSRSVLEAKSKLYEKLSSGNLTKEEKERQAHFLVRFDKKNKIGINDFPPSDSEEEPDKYPQSDEDRYESDEDANKDPGEKWVDYIDCLGRTRKCLQKDLNYIMSKDEDLKRTVETKNKTEQVDANLSFDNREDKCELVDNDDKNKNEIAPESELLSSDMRRELLRQQWEKEEAELRQKSDLHYQDILFGEARSHGVGYYGFSKDEDERAKQQEALKKLRQETEEKQKKAQELKAMREKQMAARIKAAKDRRRARLGLPPEEEPTPTPVVDIPDEEKINQEELKRNEEEKETLLEEARKKHVRPWDIGKEGVKKHYEMTQEEWVHKKRSERQEEFAPPTSYRKEFRSTVDSPEIEDTDKSLNFTTKKAKKNMPYRINSRKSHDMKNINESGGSYSNIEFKSSNNNVQYQPQNETSCSYTKRDFEEINRNSPVQPTPIINLCEDVNDFDDNLLINFSTAMQKKGWSSDSDVSDSDVESRGRGTEVAPPPSFEYYGPSHSKRRRVPQKSNIEDSVEAGLKFLRKQVEEKEKSTKHPREMFLL